MPLKAITMGMTAVFALWIATRKRPQDAVLPLILAGLNGIPLVVLGNSANGSVFSVDVALAAFMLRFGLEHGREMIELAWRRGVLGVFVLLVIWTTFVSAIAALLEPHVAKFTSYGAARWWMFGILVVLFFGLKLSDDDFARHLRNLAIALGVYGCTCLIHQHGAVDLAGSDTLGERAAEAIEAQANSDETDLAAGHRRFLGMTSANIGSICAMGAWVPMAIWARTRRNWLVWLPVAGILCWTLIGTWSRSNAMGAIAGLTLGMGLYIRYVTGRGRLMLAAGMLCVVAAGLMISIWSPAPADSATFDRYRATFNEYSAEGGGTGGHRFREHGHILNYLLDHPHVAVSGLGSNGYRRLMWHGAATMMFGHNIYIHTVFELGLPGFVLLGFWLVRVASLGRIPGTISAGWKPASQIRNAGWRPAPQETLSLTAKSMGVLVCTLVVQRAVAGWGADTFFATEGMLQSNILFLALAGLTHSAHGIIAGQEQVCYARAVSNSVSKRSVGLNPAARGTRAIAGVNGE